MPLLSRLQQGYCIGVSRRSAQAIVSEGLAQGPYMAARAGVEPTTFRLKVICSTKTPPCLGWHAGALGRLDPNNVTMTVACSQQRPHQVGLKAYFTNI